ncbi:MAG: hypothetical protein K2Y05_10325 [Hyphomicrobiaceae bacterium]|nr:hypothetical protein [Hyphomicrobiaceae bacterium]
MSIDHVAIVSFSVIPLPFGKVLSEVIDSFAECIAVVASVGAIGVFGVTAAAAGPAAEFVAGLVRAVLDRTCA